MWTLLGPANKLYCLKTCGVTYGNKLQRYSELLMIKHNEIQMAAAEVWRDEITLLWAPRDTLSTVIHNTSVTTVVKKSCR